MKRLICCFSILATISLCSLASAQDVRKVRPNGQQDGVFVDDVAQSEGMWYYLHDLRRYEDPKVMIRRKAEKKAQQRRLRIAAMKWFGYSQGRPTANPTPSTGVYSPTWIGNGADPFHWIGAGYATTVIHLNAKNTNATNATTETMTKVRR